MSLFSHYEACPKCRANGRDNRGDNCGVYRDGSKHCFSCGWHGFPKGVHRWATQLTDINDGTKSLLPPDFTREVPARAWKWLLQYGLPYSYWQQHCGYSPAEERLTFTVGTPIAFSIGRYVGEETSNTSTDGVQHRSATRDVHTTGGTSAQAHQGFGSTHGRGGLGSRSEERRLVQGEARDEAEGSSFRGSEGQANTRRSGLPARTGRTDQKVWTPSTWLQVGEVPESVVPAQDRSWRRTKKWIVWGDSHKHCELIKPVHGANPTSDRPQQNQIALVEDIVSGHKVGQVTDTIPLFGTRIYPCHLYYLINENKPVVLWLDKDQEQNVRKQALQLESVIGQPVRVVITDKDPKSYTTQQIMEVIYG